MGQPRTIIDGSGTNTFTYDAAGRMLTHTLNGMTVNTTYATNRADRAALALQQNGTNQLAHTYGYDATTGRLQTVSDGSHTATYGYLANADLLATTIFASGGTNILTTTRTHEYGFRLRGIRRSRRRDREGSGGFADTA